MAYPIYIGLITEGMTDELFLPIIVQKTFQKESLFCNKQVDIDTIEILEKSSGTFVEIISKAINNGYENFGMHILCIHADADSSSISNVMQYKFNHINNIKNDFNIKIVPIIPIQETESWMLADKDLLKEEIGTTKSDQELGINRNPEAIANPKEVIENAIRIARADLSKKRRRELTIGDLYQPIGQAIDLQKLATLPSYQHFQESVRNAFRALHLLHS